MSLTWPHQNKTLAVLEPRATEAWPLQNKTLAVLEPRATEAVETFFVPRCDSSSSQFKRRLLVATPRENDEPSFEVPTKPTCRAKPNSVFWAPLAPKVVRPGWPFRVDIWAYAAKDRALVGALPCHELEDGQGRGMRAGVEARSKVESCPLEWVVMVEPGEGLIFQQKSDVLVFKGFPVLLSFQCECAVDARPGIRTCRVTARSGSTVHEALFEIEVEEEAASVFRAVGKLRETLGYELSISDLKSLKEIDQLIRQSASKYRKAIQTVYERSREESIALSRLIGMGCRRLYSTEAGVTLFAPQHAEGMGLEEIVPPRGNLGTWFLLREACRAKKLLKSAFAPGTSWATTEMTPEWAAGMDSEYGPGAHKKFRRIRGSEGGWREGLVAEVDGAYDPGSKCMSRLEQKIKVNAVERLRHMETSDAACIELEADTVSTLFRALQLIRDMFHVTAVENRFTNPSALGWMDLSVSVEVDLGGGQKHITEIQLHLTKLREAREVAEEYLDRLRASLEKAGVRTADLDKAEWFLLNELRCAPLSETREALHGPAPKKVSLQPFGRDQLRATRSAPSKVEAGLVGRQRIEKPKRRRHSQQLRTLQRSEHAMASAPVLHAHAPEAKNMKLIRMQSEASPPTTSTMRPQTTGYGVLSAGASGSSLPSLSPITNTTIKYITYSSPAQIRAAPLHWNPSIARQGKTLTESTSVEVADEWQLRIPGSRGGGRALLQEKSVSRNRTADSDPLRPATVHDMLPKLTVFYDQFQPCY